MRRSILVGTLLLGWGLHAEAIVFHDGPSNAQRMIEFAWQQAEEIKKYAQMLEQARSMAAQVQNTVTMIEQGAKHLASMPKNGNILDWLTDAYSQSSSILGGVQSIGFNLDTASQQFEQMYRQVAELTTPEGRDARLRAMQAARLQMSGVSMQAQSIKQTFAGIYNRLAILLGISSWAEGTKALQQLAIQQQTMAQQQAQLGLTMQAVSSRLVAMEQAEGIIREQLEQAAAQYNAQQFMQGFNAAIFRGPGEGQGFQLPR